MLGVALIVLAALAALASPGRGLDLPPATRDVPALHAASPDRAERGRAHVLGKRWQRDTPGAAINGRVGVSLGGNSATAEGDAGQREAFYVSPRGIPGTDGSKERPWDLATALRQPNAVGPGDVIWLQGGIYRGNFVSQLRGSKGNRITVRAVPGERVMLDGAGFPGSVLTINGEWTRYWGFEVTNSDPARISPEPGSNPTGYSRGAGITVFAPHTKLINLVVHDVGDGIGFWDPAHNSHVYGTLVFNNGWLASDRGHGHGLYIQNSQGTKRIEDVISFNNFATGMKAYGENGHAEGVVFRKVVSFNNGSPSYREKSSRMPNILVGTTKHPADRIRVIGSHLYYPAVADGYNLQLGYVAVNKTVRVERNYVAGGSKALHLWGWSSATIKRNVFVAGDVQAHQRRMLAFVDSPAATSSEGFVWDNNQYFDATTPWLEDGRPRPFQFQKARNKYGRARQSFAEWRSITGFDRNSQYRPRLPSSVQTFFIPNRYERSRAHIVVHNWKLRKRVWVHPGKVLDRGDTYRLVNVQDYFGGPIKTGTYRGGRISVPLTDRDVAAPTGYDFTPASTAPRFNVFILVKST